MKEINSRRSIRKYMNKPIEEQKLMSLLESARLAPSGNNTQPWHFIVVRELDNRRRVMEASHHQMWMMTAPVFIVCVGAMESRIEDTKDLRVDEDSSSEELKQIIRDTAISIEHIVLEAEAEGLSTCWIAWFTQDEIRPVLGIPEDKYVVAILTVGYADEMPLQRPRRELEQLIHYEAWK
jgi:nitroreductase